MVILALDLFKVIVYGFYHGTVFHAPWFFVVRMPWFGTFVPVAGLLAWWFKYLKNQVGKGAGPRFFRWSKRGWSCFFCQCIRIQCISIGAVILNKHVHIFMYNIWYINIHLDHMMLIWSMIQWVYNGNKNNRLTEFSVTAGWFNIGLGRWQCRI